MRREVVAEWGQLVVLLLLLTAALPPLPPAIPHPHNHTRVGTFAWVAGPLKAGTRCMLAYNCRSGPLAFTNSAKLHLGYDGWYNKEKQVGGSGVESGIRVTTRS